MTLEHGTVARNAAGADETLLRAEVVRQLFSVLPFSLAGSQLLVLLLVGMLWPTANRFILFSWLAAQTLLNGARMFLLISYSKQSADIDEHSVKLLRPLRFAAIAGAILWGLSIPMFYRQGDLGLELFHVIMLAGVTAGAATSLAADLRQALWFQFCVLAPLVLQLMGAEPDSRVMHGVVILAYFLFMLGSTSRAHAQIIDNTKLRIQAADRERSIQQSEARFRRLANHDALTGLLNRHSLQTRLPDMLAHAARSAAKVSLIFIDLDRFKDINDLRGHDCGDQLLVAVAERLRQCVAADDLIVRMGGDEFVVVTTHAEEPELVESLAQAIMSALAAPLALGGELFSPRASLGIGTYPDDASDTSELLKFADIALYQAKAQGRNNRQYFAAGMRRDFSERVELEKALAAAINTDQLYLQYQPIVELATRRIVSLEALLRWRHPKRGLISPAQFIPLAESCGLINEIGEQVLKMTCAQLRDWQSEMIPLVPISVNVSPLQLRQHTLQGQVERALREWSIEGSLLQLEITESALIDAPEARAAELQALRALGLRLAIDDFGVGYSNLGYLKQLPLDCLKIDRSFVRGMLSDTRDSSLISAVVSIARALGIRLVAEGVETLQQAERLTQIGCDDGQGYFFARPMSATHVRLQLERLANTDSTTMRQRMLRWLGGDPLQAANG